MLPAQAPVPEPEEEDRDLIDFKANRISLSLFPARRWEACMRPALSLPDDSMLRPVPYCCLRVLRSPTGIVTTVSRRVELFQWTNRARNRYITGDDYDSEFRHTGTSIPPCTPRMWPTR